MYGNLEIIRLLLDHGADPNMHDSAYDATPAGWAEHHGQHEAQRLLEAREHPRAAMRTVTAAFTAVSRGQFDELASLLSFEIDWRGLPGEEGETPCCTGRGEALEAMRAGLLANGQVSVSAFVEEGNRVLAHVHPAGDTPEVRERFVVAEVRDGQITHMHGYATEVEARAALGAGSPPAANAGSPRPSEESTTSAEMT